jgi:predicted RNA-binding Zn-ribbon protein involved in translation (DUF1610 family)
MHFVPDEALDYGEIFRRGGANLGDEDFALFKCPNCDRVYLMDWEVDTVYLDPHDLRRRVDVFNKGFVCERCGVEVPSGPWAGPRASDRFRVTWGLLADSEWSWIIK